LLGLLVIIPWTFEVRGLISSPPGELILRIENQDFERFSDLKNDFSAPKTAALLSKGRCFHLSCLSTGVDQTKKI
jgi:hypothetical protein